jgi:hypothetical protein
MTGGTMHLAARGIEDIFLSEDPQITYFKIVYRRHTNFSIEEIRQNFIQKNVNFNTKVTALITKSGDLINQSSLVVTLPEINETTDGITKVAWVKDIGYRIIKSISIEINGRIINRHYGEWMYLWNELFNPHPDKAAKIIGNINELTEFTNGKKSYKLYTPLQFWFCKYAGSALPLISLLYSDVKINVEFQSLEYCLRVTPTHSIYCDADIINFSGNEIIVQNIDGVIAAGYFLSYDILTRQLYYYQITSNNFSSIPYGTVNTTKYKIIGQSTNFFIYPYTQQLTTKIITPQSYPQVQTTQYIHLGDCYLLINFIYLDDDERLKFAQSKNDYLIDQLFYTEFDEVTGPMEMIELNVDNPAKFTVFLLQLAYQFNAKNYDNYVDAFDSTQNNTSNLIVAATILLNDRERISFRSSKYFENIQQFQHTRNTGPPGVNLYSYGIEMNSSQPSGSCNMSKIETIRAKIQVNPILSTNNLGYFRSYTESHNILRISNGFGALLFE